MYALQRLMSDPLQFLMNLLYMLPAILIGFSFHEAAHAFAAHRMGDNTAKNMGRLTLDPLKHIDPVGFFCLLLLGFGWAKPVPVNPNNYKNRRRGEFWVSIAGVMTNFVIAVFCCLLFAVFQKIGIQSEMANEIVYMILYYMVYINFLLFLFNLIPVYNLDGMGVLSSVFWGKTRRYEMFMQQYGMWILLGLIFSGVFSYTLIPAIRWLVEAFSGLFMLLLGA